MNKPIYILGTGLSHNGSAVLLKDGKVCVGIEKERITRIKHDGGNDSLAINYCLDAEGIQLNEVDLVVQCENFVIPEREYFRGERVFGKGQGPEMISISHHLAHAYSAVGTSPFAQCNVMVIDGCGSPLSQFLDLHPDQKSMVPEECMNEITMQCEKDSFYYFDGQEMLPLYKDFSTMSSLASSELRLPTTENSIGGFYAAMSHYVFGNMEDVGKLMGLAPYGRKVLDHVLAFEIREGRLFVSSEWQKEFMAPFESQEHLKANFQYYADVAKWAQSQVEWAVAELFKARLGRFPHRNLCYSGGVALNAVANAKLEDLHLVDSIYFEPAAADNGLALGCAYYGWLSYLKQPKVAHDGGTCFGRKYSAEDVDTAWQAADQRGIERCLIIEEAQLMQACALALNEGKTLGWFQSGAEFGPRALGRRSILAHPGKDGMKEHINAKIKRREDFRPFAPAVLKERVGEYFEVGRKSPYMILVDRTKKEYSDQLKNVTHLDGTARVQTVDATWNPKFHALLTAFYRESGLAVLLNTSFNRKGMPIVETPREALDFFLHSALDILVIENCIFKKMN